MTNTELLEGKLACSGMKLGYIAERLGLSPAGFRLKVRGVQEFKQSEIVAICDLLGLSVEEKEAIFFA